MRLPHYYRPTAKDCALRRKSGAGRFTVSKSKHGTHLECYDMHGEPVLRITLGPAGTFYGMATAWLPALTHKNTFSTVCVEDCKKLVEEILRPIGGKATPATVRAQVEQLYNAAVKAGVVNPDDTAQMVVTPITTE